MNMITPTLLPDVQSSEDPRNIVIQRVGVKSVTYPVLVETHDGSQPSVAVIDMYVRLPAHAKGTHMSRFLEVLEGFKDPMSPAALERLMSTMLSRLDADSGMIEMKMPYFVRKTAPVSGVSSLLDHQLTLRAEQEDGRLSITLQVQTPVTSLCPCSKEISLYGAHNQRSHITIAATLASGVELPVQDLIDIAEASASCQLWSVIGCTFLPLQSTGFFCSARDVWRMLSTVGGSCVQR